MRAGLLSDPRVVLLLQSLVVPCRITARNTAELLQDPRDLELLDDLAARTGEPFQGGERELFLLPDGTPQRVFLSLHGTDQRNGCVQFTAAGRRSAEASALFWRHAERALVAVHGALPAAFTAIRDGSAPGLEELGKAAPLWPRPAAGATALRVFVRNSYRQYDDLHGCELVAVPAAAGAALANGLQQAGDRAGLPAEVFLELARAMVPRGQVGTRLQDGSIEGGFVLCADAVEGGIVRGHVEGDFLLRPRELAEVSRRSNAACMFRSAGRFAGSFTLDRQQGRFLALRVAAFDVQFEWQPRLGFRGVFPPWYRIAIEAVDGG